MRWLYRLQTRLGLTGPEGRAALALLLALLGGTVAHHWQAQQAPVPADLYAAADAAFAVAARDTARPEGPSGEAAPAEAPPALAGTAPADSTPAALAEAAVEAAAAPRRSGKPPPAPTNVNTASAAELQRLPRIGPALSQRIIDYRRAHGPFRSVEALVGVRGIGDKTVEVLRPWVRL